MARKVLVLGELKDGKFRHISFEAVAAAKTVSEGGEVTGVLLGNSVKHLAGEFIHYGADRVVTVEHENLKNYTTDGFSQAFLAVIEKENPDAIIIGHTSLGKDLAPKIASKLGSGLISDAVDVEITGRNIVFTRPIYSGKAFEKKIITDGIIFATIRPNNISAPEKDEFRTGNVEKLDVDIKDLRTVIKKIVRKTSEGIDLSEAKVVVAGGRGVKSAEGFKIRDERAKSLLATIANE